MLTEKSKITYTHERMSMYMYIPRPKHPGFATPFSSPGMPRPTSPAHPCDHPLPSTLYPLPSTLYPLPSTGPQDNGLQWERARPAGGTLEARCPPINSIKFVLRGFIPHT
jgi:hypothetical protein